ncbi:MAG: tetratricopeptide repeat protein [Gammaproteobacteria bacterium]|nr:MAG: tetratricopeptide repeat protein [Gammaproteobacteria bacterium]
MTRASERLLTLLRDGDEHLRQGRGTQADACFQEVLEQQPNNTLALHRRGAIAFLRGDPGEAIGLLRRAVATRDDDPTLCAHLANALAACGRLDEAITFWQRALESAPDYAAAHLSLGDAYLAKSDMQASESAYRKSIELAPEDPPGFIGLGRILHLTNRDREAEAALQRALEVGDGTPEVCNLVGTVLLEAGGAEAALELFESAAREQPDEPQGHAGRGLALHWLARPDEAEHAYRRALEIDPDYPLALKHLGVLLQERNQLDAAAECFEKLLQVNPDDDVARHMLAATTGAITPAAPAGYVTRLFDDYADRFDAHLGTIDYQVPEHIRDALAEVAGSDQPAWRILDLGCGTGQCGEAVRPLAAFLAGVDLSSRMIAKARERDVYDFLIVASIDEALARQEQSYDAIVAGDTFIYVGDLSGVLAACARALRADGWMAFSIENTDGDTYRLCPTGRYAHSAAYIDATAAASGMRVVYRRDIIIRVDPAPIQGQIVVLSKAV